jgi:hypothetical protein
LSEIPSEVNLVTSIQTTGVMQTARVDKVKPDGQHTKLIGDGKLIKINKSKKMLETARRSRI